jgi:hypothetical protein
VMGIPESAVVSESTCSLAAASEPPESLLDVARCRGLILCGMRLLQHAPLQHAPLQHAVSPSVPRNAFAEGIAPAYAPEMPILHIASEQSRPNSTRALEFCASWSILGGAPQGMRGGNIRALFVMFSENQGQACLSGGASRMGPIPPSRAGKKRAAPHEMRLSPQMSPSRTGAAPRAGGMRRRGAVVS